MPGYTGYVDVNELLDLLLEKWKVILGEGIVGVYLYGSLSLGDFDTESSDVDFLVVTEGKVSDEEFEALRVMHDEVAGSGLKYAKKLEGSYIPREALRKHDPENRWHPTMGIDWEFQVGPHGINWIFEREVVREHGRVVMGPNPKTLIDSVDRKDLREAICKSLSGFWSEPLAGEEPAWLKTRDYQAFAILTMCRALYGLKVGGLISKPKAAEWALENVEERWRPLIAKALVWRDKHEEGDMSEMMEFIRWTVEYGAEVCE
ncbi:MAG: aminoglycoside adenylyltransferase domain-containing protein [Chloroflexia bacterium]